MTLSGVAIMLNRLNAVYILQEEGEEPRPRTLEALMIRRPGAFEEAGKFGDVRLIIVHPEKLGV